MTDLELNKLAIYWQKRLRLQDWVIHVRLCHPDEAQGEGRTCMRLNHKSAKIKVLDPAYNDKDTSETICQDPEVTLVHELLHLHFTMFDHPFNTKGKDNDPYVEHREYEEQVIEILAQALVAENRECHKSSTSPSSP